MQADAKERDEKPVEAVIKRGEKKTSLLIKMAITVISAPYPAAAPSRARTLALSAQEHARRSVEPSWRSDRPRFQGITYRHGCFAFVFVSFLSLEKKKKS